MWYDFYCDTCGEIQTVKASIETGPGLRNCANGHLARRLFGTPQPAIVYLDGPAYVDKAYRGEEKVPGLPLRAIRARVDGDVAVKQRGRANRKDYSNARRRVR